MGWVGGGVEAGVECNRDGSEKERLRDWKGVKQKSSVENQRKFMRQECKWREES